tara:strand:- start:1161 stop:1433 length:273 start_codon:yes stop_codon:yes gene_type:complete
MNKLTPIELLDLYKAFNQILALIIGRRFARQSEHLHNKTIERLDYCQDLIKQELKEACDLQDTIRVKQATRKLDSLDSLVTIFSFLRRLD